MRNRFLFLFLGLAVCSCGTPPSGPELIMTGGRIYVGPDGNTVVSALAIQGDALLALGNDEEIRALANDDTQEMPLEGATVLAGLHDAWVDLFAVGAAEEWVDLRRTATLRDVQAKLRAELGNDPDILVGWGWDERRWPAPTTPPSSVLDEVVGDRPVVLYRRAGRVAWLNSVAIELAGVGGRELSWHGNQTGLVTGGVLNRVEQVLLPLERESARKWVRRALRAAASAGITSLTTAPLQQQGVDLLAGMDPADITIRVSGRLGPGASAATASGLLSFDALGLDLDGPLALYLGALSQPYADGREAAVVDRPLLDAACARAAQTNLPLDVQARGDAAIAAALECSRTRWVIGADVLPAEVLPRGSTLVAVPGRLGRDLYWLDEVIGLDRAERTHAYREMARNGWLGGIASLAPANAMRPLGALRIMLTRKDRDGHPLDGWQAAQRLAVGDSLRALMAAGPLAPELTAGRPADLVVWSEDPFAGESELTRARALLVLVQGRVVYSRPLVTPPMDWHQGR
jgi:predicted amidohydrolase YtcJ